MNMKIGCVLMASGDARRFGENKLNSTVNNKTLIELAFDSIPNNNAEKIVVVSQYDEVLDMALGCGYIAVKNAHPDFGISHTIKLGLSKCEDCDAVMFMVSDQPLLKKSTVCDMIDFFKENQSFIVSLSYNKKRGNPCIFPKEFFSELFNLSEDNGGSTIIRNHPERLLMFEASFSDELSDIDTKDDLLRLNKKAEIFGIN